MKKNKNIVFVSMFVLLSLLLIGFNYYVDPYGYRPEKVKEIKKLDVNSVPKDMVYTYLNKTKDVSIEAVIIGTSSASSLFHPNLFHCYTSNKIAILSLPSLSLAETYDLLKYFLNLHPEVKHVYVSFDVNTYLYCVPYNSIPKKPTGFFQDFIKLYYSVDIFKLSLNELLNKFKKPSSDGESFYYVNKKRKYSYHSGTNDCMKTNINTLKEIKQLIESKNIETTYFMTPLHALYLSNMYKTNQLDKVENLKREFAQIVPFYDMAYINRHTVEPFEYFWADVIHPMPYINDKVYDVLVYNQERSDIAVLVNSENIEDVLLTQRKLIEEYIENNKEYVEEYVSSDIEEKDVEAYAEKRKGPNLPADCSIMDKCVVEFKGRF